MERFGKKTAVAAGLGLAALAAVLLPSARNAREREEFSRALAPDRPYAVRRQVLWRIAQRRDGRFEKPLFACSSDADPRIREVCAYAWGRLGGPRAIAVLRDKLLNDPAGIVRRTAVTALADIPGGVSQPELERYAGSHDPYQRQAALLALWRRGRPEAITPLFESARGRQDELGQFARRVLVRTTTPLLESMGRSDLLLPEPDSPEFVEATRRAQAWLDKHLRAADLASNRSWATQAAVALRRVMRLRRARRTACRVLGLPRPPEWYAFAYWW